MLAEGPHIPAIGDVVAGAYVVHRVLGKGGMGVVVHATHRTSGAPVAIKLGRSEASQEVTARFLAEARAVATIDSQHVCRVFDVGLEDDGVPFMVMELLEGEDLERAVRAGPIPVATAADWVRQAARGIAAAHRLGIVHRDLKPSNLIATADADGVRRVKVVDFGISRLGPDDPFASDDGTFGTPAYMSPEQVRGEDIDARSDVWALGAILYELLTGHDAFVGDSVQAVFEMVLSEAPCPMGVLRRGIPDELQAVVTRCLARDRDARWPSAEALAEALAPFADGWPSTPSVRCRISSVEPMVSSVREAMITQPDHEEALAPREVVIDWSRDRARHRRARSVVRLMAAAACLFGAAAIVAKQSGPSERPAAVAPARPPVVEFGEPGVTALDGGIELANHAKHEPPSVHSAGKRVHPASFVEGSARGRPSRAP